MSITEKILKLLNTKTSKYKGVPINIIGLPIFKEYHKQSVRNAVSKLRSKNFILYSGTSIKITSDGEEYLRKRSMFLQKFESSLKNKQNKDLLVLFDIPEERKAEREWFRRHLVKFSYIMVQKSVWVGPSPLPKEFVEYVKKIKLKDSIKTFKLAKSYIKYL